MAEEIFNFLDFTKSAESFDEFEALWTQMGEQLEKEAFLPSPQKVVTTTPVVSNDSTNISLGVSFQSSCTSEKLIASEPSSSLSQPEKLITIEPMASPKLEHFISLEPSSFPKYSPAHDENWPPVIDLETGEKSNFNDVEDSILTTFRRNNPKKYSALEKKLRAPLQENRAPLQGNVEEQFQVLRKLQKRMSNDLEQSVILLNYLEDKCSTNRSRKKRVKLTTF